MRKICSTLEDKGEGELFDSSENQGSLDSVQETTKSLMKKAKSMFKQRLFQINHIVLQNHVLTEGIFQVLILIEFLQMLFFIFFKVVIRNEFQQYSVQDEQGFSYSQPNSLQNLTISTKNYTTGIIGPQAQILNTVTSSTAASSALSQQITSIYGVFEFVNFQLYFMKQGDKAIFEQIYDGFVCVFAALVIILAVTAHKTYQQIRTADNVSDWIKYLSKVISAMVIVSLHLFEMPFVTVLIQQITCEEDQIQSEYAIEGVICGDSGYQLMAAISAIILAIYLGYLGIEYQVFTSQRFKSEIPWAGFHRDVPLVRSVLKLILVLSFGFGKNLSPRTHSLILLACFLLAFYALIKRLTTAVHFKPWIHFSTTFYDFTVSILLLALPLHVLIVREEGGSNQLTIAMLVSLALCSLVLTTISLYIQYLRVEREMFQWFSPSNERSAHFGKSSKDEDLQIQLFHMYRMIDRNGQEDQMEMLALVSAHALECSAYQCKCTDILAKIDRLRYHQKRQRDYQSMFKVNTVSEKFADATQFNHDVEFFGRYEPDTIKTLKGYMAKNTGDIPHQVSEKYDNNYSTGRGASFLSKQPIITRQLDQDAFDLIEKDEMENLYDAKKAQKAFFAFLAQLLRFHIETNPKTVSFRLIYANLLKDKLHNNFKSCFEILKCLGMGPTLKEEFEIYRMRNEIEIAFTQSHQKEVNRQGFINITQVYDYEKLYSKYIFKEYQVAHDSLGFWRELMQKNLDAQAINAKGTLISRSYHKIQDLSQQLQKRYPNDMKFMFRYGMFLLKIINSDFDATEILKRIQLIYELKTAKKSATNGTQTYTEHQIYGENTAAGIVLIQANDRQIGKIIHINDEVEYLLGYNKNTLLGVNVSILLPQIFRPHHERFIHRYMDSGKERVLHKRRKNFAVNKDGYLIPVELMIKVYPQINGHIVFAGFLQKSPAFTLMPPVKLGYEKLEQNYIMTDQNGYISNISEGLLYEIGLNSKFFLVKSIDSINRVMNIQSLCSQICYPEVADSFEAEPSQVLQFDTSRILDQVEIESLSSEEVLEVKSNLGKFQVYTQFMKWIIDPTFCTVNVYRLIVLSRANFNEIDPNCSQKFSNQALTDMLGTSILQQSEQIQQKKDQDTVSYAHDSIESRLSLLQRSSSMHSMSSTSGEGSSQSVDGIIRDFKRKLNERQTPKALIILNRLIILIILGTILLTAVDYLRLEQEIDDLSGENQHNLNSERRTLEFTELAVNSRSWLNAGLGIEFDLYDMQELNNLDFRFDLMGRFIQQQAEQLKGIHDFMTQQRVTDDAGTDELQSAFEYEYIRLYKLEKKKHVERWDVQYRVGMYQFFNEIQNMNESTRADISLPNEVISHPPTDNETFFTANFTDYQLSAYFIITNGLRSLRVKTRNATAFQQETSFANLSQNPFLIIMVVAIVITVISQVAVLIQIWRIEKIQSEILSLYALVSIENIGGLYDQCADYLEILEKSSLMSLIDNQPKVQQILIDQSTFQKRSVIDPKKTRGNQQQDDDQLSEEEKETQLYREYVQAKFKHQTHRKVGTGGSGKRGKSRLSAIVGGSSEGDPEMLGKDLYAKIIKKAYSDIKQHQSLQAQSISKQKEKLRKEEKRDSGSPKSIRVEPDGVVAANKKKKQQHLARTFDIQIDEDVSSASLSDVDESAAESKKGDPKNVATKKIRVGRPYENEERIVSRRDQLKRQESMTMSNIESIDNIEDRKEAFKKSMKSQNKGLKIINIMVTIIFCTYFIVTYFFHEYFKGNLELLQKSIPIFFNRYRFLMLSNGLLRERIIFNNSLDTFESIPGYGYNADLYYLDQSIENDKLLQEIKVTKPAILQKMIDFLLASDSTEFCSTIIGQNSFYDDDESSIKKISSRGIKVTQYQTQIKTIVKACQAAFDGDIQILLELTQRGLNFSQADYNGLTPLYHAVRGNRTSVVEFLLRTNVQFNAIDRWGGTVLNYAYRGSEIERLLLQVGAKRGKDQVLIHPPKRSNLTENDYRLLYAASFGDLRTIQLLKNQGQKINFVDIESRSPLHLAACSGNLAAVEFLVDNGADVMKVDSRGIDPVIDAINSGHQTIHEYLDSVMSDSIIKKNCMTFADGLFAQGVHSAIGTFRKKFADLQILVNQTSSHARRMTLLFGDRYSRTPSPLNQTILKTYFQSQELYFSRVVEYMVTSMMETYSEFMDLYHAQTAVIFGVFISFQVVILLWLRTKMLQKMKREVFENRGILNLIPGHVFDQNKQEVEKLIKKIKD